MIAKVEQFLQFEKAENVPTTGLREYIVELAKHYGITYVKTPHDKLAEVITHLSDDDVKLDDIQCLLVALQRAGAINKKQMGQVLVRYLREKHHVRPI